MNGFKLKNKLLKATCSKMKSIYKIITNYLIKSHLTKCNIYLFTCLMYSKIQLVII